MCGLWDVPRNKIAVKIFIMIKKSLYMNWS